MEILILIAIVVVLFVVWPKIKKWIKGSPDKK